MVGMPTPKESYVYRPNQITPTKCDSFGVECRNGRHFFYKHTIPSGLISDNIFVPRKMNGYVCTKKHHDLFSECKN